MFKAVDQATQKNRDLVTKTLHNLLTEFQIVTARQLADFLPNGRYFDVQDEQIRSRMKHSVLTNLVGEECIGL